MFSATSEAQIRVAGMIGHAPLKVALPSLARKLGVAERRLKAFLYGEARRIDSAEMDALRRGTITASFDEARSQAERLAARFEAEANALVEIHPEIYRREADRLRRMADRYRALASEEGAP